MANQNVQVLKAATCQLAISDTQPPQLRALSGAIAAHWARVSAETPAYFNGAVFLASAHGVAQGHAAIACVESTFASYLYLRHNNWPAEGIANAFGTALLVPSDGGVLCAVGAPNTVNAGSTYLPGGFIDTGDVRISPEGGRTIDIDGQILRELAEETGLAAQTLSFGDGYLLASMPGELSIARIVRCQLPGAAIVESVRAANAAMATPELADPKIVRAVPAKGDASAPPLLAYAEALLAHVFDEGLA
ncbi:MAG: NUDIX hydrolase [Pseudomonadota bacterium]